MRKEPKRILIVEDDRFLSKACEASLSQQGFQVTCAVDGEEGLRTAQEQRFDLVVLDLLMPKLSGIDVLSALKSSERTREIPVVILSNSAREEDRQRAFALNAAAYYIKANLSLKALGAEIARLVS